MKQEAWKINGCLPGLYDIVKKLSIYIALYSFSGVLIVNV